MFNSKIKLFTRNILETGTFTVTGDADSGYPKARLHDRDISLYWKNTSIDNFSFWVDQGASPVAVDSLIINGHNFDGENLYWQYSDNNVVWNNAVTPWLQSGNSQIVKTLTTALTNRYWRLVLGVAPTTTTTTTSTVSTTSSSSSTESTTSTMSSTSTTMTTA